MSLVNKTKSLNIHIQTPKDYCSNINKEDPNQMSDKILHKFDELLKYFLKD